MFSTLSHSDHNHSYQYLATPLLQGSEIKPRYVPWADLGGNSVAIFIRKELNCTQHSSHLQLQSQECEMSTVKIPYCAQPIFLRVVYRPPRQPMSFRRAVFDQLSDLFEDQNCILVGDFSAVRDTVRDIVRGKYGELVP